MTKLLVALRQNGFAFIDVLEILMRYYKAEPERFRPVDRMIAHTGFLIFARPIIPAALKPPVSEASVDDEEDFSSNASE